MLDPQEERIRYPIGRFTPRELDKAARADLVTRLGDFGFNARAVVSGVDVTDLDLTYRDGGWTPRQIAHHLADSHMNAFVRSKLILTEDRPRLKPYDQVAWSTMPDVLIMPVASSLDILDGIHRRWSTLMFEASDDDFARVGIHEDDGEVSLEWILQIYVWHGEHHLAQIESLAHRSSVL